MPEVVVPHGMVFLVTYTRTVSPGFAGIAQPIPVRLTQNRVEWRATSYADVPEKLVLLFFVSLALYTTIPIFVFAFVPLQMPWFLSVTFMIWLDLLTKHRLPNHPEPQQPSHIQLPPSPTPLQCQPHWVLRKVAKHQWCYDVFLLWSKSNNPWCQTISSYSCSLSYTSIFP